MYSTVQVSLWEEHKYRDALVAWQQLQIPPHTQPVQNLCVATLQISPAVPTQSASRGVAMQKDRKKPLPPPPLLGPPTSRPPGNK
jgi:hypothetical protein